MKSLRLAPLAAFVILTTSLAIAQGDPVIRTGGGDGSVPVTSQIFTISTATGQSPTDGTPCTVTQKGNSTSAPGCFFLNNLSTDDGDGTIRELIFIAPKDYSGPLTCALSTALGGQSPWFTQCSASGHVVKFYGGPGIPPGGDFSFGFRGWNTNASFRVVASTETDD